MVTVPGMSWLILAVDPVCAAIVNEPMARLTYWVTVASAWLRHPAVSGVLVEYSRESMCADGCAGCELQGAVAVRGAGQRDAEADVDGEVGDSG